MPTSVGTPKFDHDLLARPDDLATARELYPGLFDALYHPELIEYFKNFNDCANSAKRKSRRLGTWAILLGGVAIALAATDVAIRVLLSGDVAVLLIVGLIAAVSGLISAALGAFGTLIGPRKHEWLINRFMGERIRQFHFQSLLAQLPLVLAAADSKEARTEQATVRSEGLVGDEKENAAAPDLARKSFLQHRHRRFVAFQAAFDELPKEAKFGSTVGPGGEEEWRLCESQASLPAKSAGLHTFFDAYRQLRLQHQLDFANYKLTSDPKIFSEMPRRQSELLANVGKFGIQFVIVVHICVVFIIVLSLLGLLLGHRTEFEAATAVTGIFAFAIIALAVVSLCTHAFAQGLQPEREIERYQQYGSAIKSLVGQFDEAVDPSDKLKVMWQMERAAYEEMRNFLITHHERSSFAM
jgi:hypothetical protein